MFHPVDFEDGPLVLIKVRENLEGECLKLRPVRKLLLLVRHPDVLRNICALEPSMEGGLVATESV